MNTSRRQFVRGSLICGIAALSESTRSALAQTGPVAAVAPGPEVDAFKTAQQRLFQKYDTSVRSRYVKLEEPALTAHVIEAGRGDPVLMLHGGGSFACQFAPLIGLLRHEFHLFAADRPGCGLTDKIDYRHIVLRQHAVDVVTSLLDSLDLPRAALIGNSMGGLWALQFALAKPERVAGLVLLGEPAWSGAVPHPPPPAGKIPSIEGVRADSCPSVQTSGRSLKTSQNVPISFASSTLFSTLAGLTTKPFAPSS